MSVHNVEVHRCRWCTEEVVTVPEGFTMTKAELAARAKEHAKECRATLEESSRKMTSMTDSAPASLVAWRDWTQEDKAKQPRRTCSVAGCKEAPSRVKETTTHRNDGTPSVRKHAYCAAHAQADA